MRIAKFRQGQMMKLLNSRGLTLAELMVTAAILVVVVSGLMSMFVYCLLLNEANNNLVTATNDGQFVLEELKALAYSDIASYSAPALSHLANEAITIARTTINSRLTGLVITVQWVEKGRSRSVTLSTQIARTN